jgi:hypothetical protein
MDYVFKKSLILSVDKNIDERDRNENVDIKVSAHDAFLK